MYTPYLSIFPPLAGKVNNGHKLITLLKMYKKSDAFARILYSYLILMTRNKRRIRKINEGLTYLHCLKKLLLKEKKM